MTQYKEDQIDIETIRRFADYLIESSGGIQGAINWVNQGIAGNIMFAQLLRQKSKWTIAEIKSHFEKSVHPLKLTKGFLMEKLSEKPE